jgi:gluconolactonase
MNRLTAVALAAGLVMSVVSMRVLAADLPPYPTPTPPVSFKAPYPTVGQIERLDPELDRLIPRDAKIEKLATGFLWSEGPVWVKNGGYLLFSDVKANTTYKWQDGQGISVFLRPSGYFGTTWHSIEPGANGLTMDAQGRLTLCEHGERRIARLNADKTQTALANHFEGKRFNSPNDIIFDSQGNLYFTDPPYGLDGTFKSAQREIDFCGVYRVSRDGKVSLVTRELSAPNGIALSPDEKTLYVGSSDAAKAIWMAFDLHPDGTVANGRIFADVTAQARKGLPGLPDGMKVDKQGNLFATGPGGVYIFTPQGTISPGDRTGNCAWGDDGHTLYMCNNDNLIRIRLTTEGKQP